MSTTPYTNTFGKYSVLFRISSMNGLWTADTWAMSADTQIRHLGQWTPRDRWLQFGPCIDEVLTPLGEDRKLYCEPYIAYLRPCNLDDDSNSWPSECVHGSWVAEIVNDMCFRYGLLGKTSLDVYVFSGSGLGLGFGLREVFFCCVLVYWSYPIFPYSLFSCLCQQISWDLKEDLRVFVCFLFSSALSTWFVHFVWNALGQRGSVGMGFGPMACSHHGPPPAPIPRSRASFGIVACHPSPDEILGFAVYAPFFPIYICLSFSLSAL